MKFLRHNSKKKVLAVLLLTLVVLATTSVMLTLEKAPSAHAAWYSDPAWLYRQKITIDHTKVVNSDQTDFPVMIKITNQYSGVFSNAKDDGTDILFTSSDGLTKLSHEIESFSKSNKELIVWVKVPTLSFATDTTLYMYYGNAEASDQQNKTDVWSNGYAGVWHVPNGTTLSTNDSLNVYNLTNTGPVTATSGKIFGGVNGFTTNKGLSATGGTSLNSSNWTAEGWIYRTGTASYSNTVLGHMPVGATGGHWMFYANSSNKLDIDLPYVKGNVVVGNSTVAQNEWVHVAATKNGNVYTVYYNGSSDGSVTDSIANVVAGDLYAGNASSMTHPFLGSLDELRVSSTARSSDWVATQYNNQANPEGFISVNYELSYNNYLTTSEANWISSAWLYKQKIRVTNNTSSNLNNVQVLVSSSNVDLTNVFAKAKANGEDIRFTSVGSSVELPYYIESYSAVGSSAQIYVKVPYLPASGTTDIYLYYGNANASVSTSSGANTFTSFDDFSDGSLDSKWTLTSGNGSITESAGALNFNYTGSENNDWWSSGKPQKIVKLNSLPTGDFEASVKLNSYSPGISTHAGISVYNTDTSAYAWGRYLGSGGTVNNFQIEKLGTGGVATLANTTLPKYLAVRKIGAAYSFWSSDNRITWVKSGADYSDLAFNNIALFGKEWGSANHSFSMDDFRIKNYVATDPGVALSGSEEALDNTAPSNPSSFIGKNISGGAITLNPANVYNYATPHFDWPDVGQGGGAIDNATGVDGYYLYLGDSCGAEGADPAVSRGVLADNGSGLHFTSATELSAPTLTDGNYCLRIRTKDIAGNVSATVEAFVYKLESVAPSAPSYIAANPTGYSASDSFAFSWPVASDHTSDPQSNVLGYQYKRGDGSGDEWSEIITATTVNDIASYQTGENIFMVRSVDNAGNVSPSVQTTYYYSSNPPTKPTSLSATPELSDTNSFAFSWSPPDPPHSIPIAKYGYSINAYPTTENLIWTEDNTTSLPANSFATLQGENKIYVVAKDESGVFSLESSAVAETTFVCTTAAPPAPLNLAVSDSSNRAVSIWALTLKWSAGTNQNAETFSHYSIERSLDGGQSYSEIATTQSLAYIDVSGLTNSTNYFYRVKSVDNANSKSAPSAVVSKMPTGRFETPPVIVANPSVVTKASSAIISWTVNRISSSSVRFGTDRNHLDRVQINSSEDTDHAVTLDGLEAGTKYYYQVQALDNYRDYSSESAFSTTYEFTTLAAPGIKDLSVQNITISSAEVIFETSTASTVTMEYGASISYGSIVENDSLTTLHTAKLEKLTPGTRYHLRIRGTDLDGNTLSSDDYVFETLPMPAISNLTVQPDYLGPNPGIKINWKTNVPTSSSVEYIPKLGTISEEESKSALTTEHEILLTGLADSTSYRFYVYGTDQFGNTARSDQNSLDTPLDSRPPKITDLNIESQSIGANQDAKAQIIISWKTDEPATSQVEYGEGSSGASYTSKTQKDTSLTESHTVIISNLDPSKTYHLRAVSEDKANNPASSEDNAVITKKAQVSPFNIILSSLAKAFSWLKIFQ